ncbi:hypothetical protein VKT23_018473 [Stygiomarasmius scandens]|uniref:Lectin n=1 Tax=Marasmiellus scandens TaxID=2682957 RepID=A0ABR1INV3_9AGAR
MFKTFCTRIALGLLFVPITFSIVTASPLELPRGDANTCPYPFPYSEARRSLIPRQNKNDLSFQGVQCIWSKDAALGPQAFRKTIDTSQGDKIPSTFKIAFASDDFATLFINGEYIATKDNWVASGTYCTLLQPFKNVIAFSVTNKPNPGGLLVAAEVTYTDGSTSQILTDESWLTSGTSIPDGWEQLSFDDSSWASATLLGPYPNLDTGTWDNILIAESNPVSLLPAFWIWTNELKNPAENVPVNTSRAFRHTVILPTGHTSASAEILVTADDVYSLYMNGRFIGSGTNDYRDPQRFAVDDIQIDNDGKVVVAVYAENTEPPDPTPAGVLVSLQITSKNPSSCIDCSSLTYVVTSPEWKAYPGAVPDGFEQPDFDDSDWPAAFSEGNGSSSHWGEVSDPSETSEPRTPISGAPSGN